MASPEPEETGLNALLERAAGRLAGPGEGWRFGVAVSGGPDSMALLDLSARLFQGRVEAATVDHGLRQASAEEAAMVAAWCGDRAIPHAILHPAEPVTGNVQQWAREQRYAALEQWRTGRGIDWIFTAHHADDQLETMVMRLNRGAGVGGLAGIRARQGRVLRPLLGARRSHLLAYVQRRAIPYVEDPSNSDLRFDRASIRQRLSGVDWLDPVTAARSAGALAEAAEALDWMADDLAARHVRRDGKAWVLDDASFPREIMRRLLLRMIALAAPDAPPPRGEALDRAMAALSAGQQVSLGPVLLKGGEQWRVRLAPPRR